MTTDLQSFAYHIGEAITPLDGRNKHKIQPLIQYFSEIALDRYRLLIEIKYLQKLSTSRIIRKFNTRESATLDQMVDRFDENDYQSIRQTEKRVNHDVKAVEEYLKQKLSITSLKDVSPMVHFGLTSDDINNLAYGLMIKNCLDKVIYPELEKIGDGLMKQAKQYKQLAMLARTHGQPAVPTTLGKELAVYYQRFNTETGKLRNLEIKGKLTGNVGNLNAHKFIFPKINWLKFSQEFVTGLGLKPDLITTQIESYDSLISVFQTLISINNILTGLSVDCWWYISLGYLKQKLIKTEVGSTALPHKINPIYFEGAEGGLGIANALLEFYCRKLSYSRLQRDLSDSTIRRSFGTCFGYCLLSYQSIKEGLTRIEADSETIREDLRRHPEILSEAIQNFLRVRNHSDGYEKTKKYFRGKAVNSDSIKKFIKSLNLDKKDERKLSALSVEKYTGYAEEIVEKFS